MDLQFDWFGFSNFSFPIQPHSDDASVTLQGTYMFFGNPISTIHRHNVKRSQPLDTTLGQ